MYGPLQPERLTLWPPPSRKGSSEGEGAGLLGVAKTCPRLIKWNLAPVTVGSSCGQRGRADSGTSRSSDHGAATNACSDELDAEFREEVALDRAEGPERLARHAMAEIARQLAKEDSLRIARSID